MRKTPNPHAVRFVINLTVAIAFILLVAFLLYGCSSAAKMAKKKEAVYQTVLTDSAMFRSIGDKWRKINPCTNDTILGETQVLILSDTTLLPGKTDTLVRPDTVRIVQTKTNTVTKYIVDNKAIYELQDSLHGARGREAHQRGQITQLDKDRTTEHAARVLAQKRQKQLGWGVWGLIAVLLITHGIRSLPSFKKLL